MGTAQVAAAPTGYVFAQSQNAGGPYTAPVVPVYATVAVRENSPISDLYDLFLVQPNTSYSVPATATTVANSNIYYALGQSDAIISPAYARCGSVGAICTLNNPGNVFRSAPKRWIFYSSKTDPDKVVYRLRSFIQTTAVACTGDNFGVPGGGVGDCLEAAQ
jgi:hypothetical protein